MTERIPNEIPCSRCLKGTMYLVTGDDGTLWYVCNNKCCMHEEEVTRGGPVKQCAPIIDADQTNLDLRSGKVLQTFRSGNMVIKEVAL